MCNKQKKIIFRQFTLKLVLFQGHTFNGMVEYNFSALSILLFFTLVTALITKPGQVSLNTELSEITRSGRPGLELRS